MATRDDGYTLVGLMIAVALVNIALAAAVTSWVTLDRRAREAELIWRGQQIGRAIACFEAASPSEPLAKLEQLVEADCLRRLYGDPMVTDGSWRVLTQQDVADGTVAALMGQAPDEQPPDEQPPGAALAPGTAGTGLGLSRLFQRGLASAPGPVGGGGNRVVGVASQAAGSSLRTFQGRSRYAEWVFLGQATGTPIR